MKTSIATVRLAWHPEEKCRPVLEGFDGIEIFEQDLVVSPSSPAEISTGRSPDLTLTSTSPSAI